MAPGSCSTARRTLISISVGRRGSVTSTAQVRRRSGPCDTARRREVPMSDASNISAPTQFVETRLEKYAYRRFGNGHGLPLLCLQHFTGTLDNWDPAVTDPLASDREVILFESAGLGRSTGQVPTTVPGMAAHALAFVDALGLTRADLLGFSLGGMVAQEMALERPSLVRRMLLVGTAPEGGEDIMHMDKPELKAIYGSSLPTSQRLVKLFFAPSR